MSAKKYILGALALLSACVLCGQAAARPAGDGAVETGIVIAAFGTSVAEARADYETIDRAVRKRFPGLPVEWGYTAKFVRAKVRAAEKIDLLPVEAALVRLAEQGVKRAAVLSLFLVPGEEYADVGRICAAFEGLPQGLERIAQSAPLISGAAEAQKLASVLAKAFPPAEDGGVLFVGHGSPESQGSLAYAALAWYLKNINPRLAIGVIEGEPSLDAALASLRGQQAKKVLLAPLLVVAGDHARNDIAGKDGSLAERCRREGLASRAILKGLPSVPAVTDMWLDRLEAALRTLE